MDANLIHLSTGDVARFDAVTENIFRIRINRDGIFHPSVTERYGIVRMDWGPVQYELSESKAAVEIKTGSAILVLNKKDGTAMLYDKTKGILMNCMKPFSHCDETGVGASFALSREEKFYGLGYRKTDSIQLRGSTFRNHVAYGESYGPVPFIMSSCGWGLYFNTTFDSYFDIGKNHPEFMNIWSEKGDLDFYLMAGNYAGILDSFTQITGRPSLMPLYGYGLMFICNEKQSQFDVLNDARTFRQEGIPCDMLGLEPGWMSVHYDCSTKRDWSYERFYMPTWSENRREFQDVNFIGALRRYGFNLSLWLCCDYDVFEEEERQASLKETAGDGKAGKLQKPFGFGSLDFDTRVHEPIRLDKLTKKGEPWFEHLKKFIDSGVRIFKQDPAYVVNDHPDRFYANGMTDEEAHNLMITVLAKQVHKGYREYTNERPMHFVGTGYTGIQRWAPAWTCDCGGRDTAVMGLLQYGLYGHMNVTCDMDVHTPEGIHFGFLQPWSQVNSWAYIDHPWWLGEELKQVFLEYAKLHYKLVPYIYSYAHIGYQTGMPILRAMPLMFPDDPEAENLTHQYMLGDWLLAGAFTEDIYLPEGSWIDYWSGEAYEGKQHIRYRPPAGKGGALFVRRGAILPMSPEVAWLGEKQPETLELHVFPGGESTFALYEDDGISFEYEKGGFTSTAIKVKTESGTLTVDIGPRTGSFEGMAAARKYTVRIHGGEWEKVIINGAEG